MFNKGIIRSFGDETDRNGDPITLVLSPVTARDCESPSLVIPWYLRGKMGALNVGDEVIFQEFLDNTGIVISRVDGDWNGIVPGDLWLGDDDEAQYVALENLVGAELDKIHDAIDQLKSDFNLHKHIISVGGIAVSGSATAQANAAPITVPATMDSSSAEYSPESVSAEMVKAK